MECESADWKGKGKICNVFPFKTIGTRGCRPVHGEMEKKDETAIFNGQAVKPHILLDE